MTIWAKVGTGPAETVHVVQKSKPPNVGDQFKIKVTRSAPFGTWEETIRVRVDEIRQAYGKDLYILERW